MNRARHKLFKRHLRQARKHHWPEDVAKIEAVDQRCPFDCTFCPLLFSCNMHWNNCVVFPDKRDYFGIWRDQRFWFRSLSENEITEIIDSVWGKE